jgi:hypothetical protein
MSCYSAVKMRTAVLCTALLAAKLFAGQKCEMTFTTCPESFSGQTISVPQNVVAIAPKVHACKSTQVIQSTTTTGATPSIVFVIDNSGSMKTNPGNDRTGSRFTVTKALLDTLFKAQPQTEVGLIVFREHLFFDVTTSQYYTKYFKTLSAVLDSEPDQAYLPFTTLNQMYDGKRGIDIIKDILTTDTIGSGSQSYVDLVYQPNYSRSTSGGETNINGAFIAAKEAFLAAKNPKEQQYIIFLSDGEPAGNTQAGHASNYFDTPEGVANVSTTFTVYFNANGQRPASLVTMTDNIKINGYSATNPKSDLWTLNTSFDALLNLLMNNVIKTILVPANPIKMVLNGETSVIYGYIDSSFSFPDSFPIGSDSTRFTMNISYHYTLPSTGQQKDTTDTIVFYVKRTNQTALPTGIGEICEQYIQTIPVTAIMRDGNGNGHLDTIDIVWQDTAKIKEAMPSISDFIQTLQITSLDGGIPVTLHPIALVPDLANKTIHIVLQENTGPTLETGWSSATVTLKPIPMNVNGDSPFEVIRVVDSAGPVIKAVYYIPTKTHDSIVVIFSEPVDWTKSNQNTSMIFDFLKNTATFPVGNINPDPAKTQELPDRITYIIPQHNEAFRQFVDSLKAVLPPGGVPSIVDTKGNTPPVSGGPPVPVQLIANTRVVIDRSVAYPNPFVPPTSFTMAPNTGIKIEAHLTISLPDVEGFKTITGTMNLYDAVGNVIVKNQYMTVDIGKNTISTYWNGYTSRGTKAAGGTYVARVVVQNSADGSSDTKTMYIGIRGTAK